MGESYFWKPFAQGVATPIVLIGGTNLLLKDFKVSNPYLYWGGLAASSAIVVGILADKIKVPILNAEGDSWDGSTGDDFRKYDDTELSEKDHEIILDEIERGFENYPADTLRNAKASAVSQINWFGIDKSHGDYDAETGRSKDEAYDESGGRCEICETKHSLVDYNMNMNMGEMPPHWIIICSDCEHKANYGAETFEADMSVGNEMLRQLGESYRQTWDLERGYYVPDKAQKQYEAETKRFKKIARKYGFKAYFMGDAGNKDLPNQVVLEAKNTDGEWNTWFTINLDTGKLRLRGNTDHLNLWFYRTRRDMTPRKLVRFVKEINAFITSVKPHVLVRHLIDPEDYQELKGTPNDAYDDERYFMGAEEFGAD